MLIFRCPKCEKEYKVVYEGNGELYYLLDDNRYWIYVDNENQVCKNCE